MNYDIVSFELSPNDIKILKAEAKKNKVTFNQYLTDILSTYLIDLKDKEIAALKEEIKNLKRRK